MEYIKYKPNRIPRTNEEAEKFGYTGGVILTPLGEFQWERTRVIWTWMAIIGAFLAGILLGSYQL
jgi:hypothetical protein